MLATCNRIEVFAEVERFHGGVDRRQPGAGPPGRRDRRGALPVRHRALRGPGRRAPVHRRRRAWTRWSSARPRCSGQLRAAYALAREEGTVGRALHPVAQRALRVGKRVHTETGIDRAGASLVSVALDRAEERIGSLDGRSVLVVGAGSMGALAATTLARRGRRRRRQQPDRGARRPAGRQRRRPRRRARGPAGGAGRRRRARHLHRRDRPRRRHRRRRRRHGGRARRPLAVVDLALPRDVDPGVAALPGVHVVDLALLQGERAATPGRPTAGPGRRRRHRRRPRPGRGRDRAAARRAPGRRGRPDRLRAAQPGRRGRRRRAAAAGRPAARPRRPRPRRDRPHRAPGRRQAAARADRAGEGTGRDAGRDRLRRCPARALRPGHRRPRRRRGRDPRRGRHGRPRARAGEAS